MIAYNRQQLDNLAAQQEACEAFSKGFITEADYNRIRAEFPYAFYTPNIFVRIGLFLLTVLISVCVLGLLLLMGIGDEHFGGIILFCGLLSFGVLELFIRVRNFYQAGVDDALLWIAGSLILTGVLFEAEHLRPAAISGVVLVIALWGSLRYVDHVMGLVAYGALLCLIFYSFSELGVVARSLLPFLVMAISAFLGFLFTRWGKLAGLRHYHSCLVLLRAATLVSVYLAGNYFVDREVNEKLNGGPGPVMLGWLWWLLTAVVPVLYVFNGIRKKDIVFVWVGLGSVAASVFTVRYYYHLLPAELAMMIGGVVLIGGAYGLIRYLAEPKRGFTSAALEERSGVEGVIIAETFRLTGAHAADSSHDFGGGSGGGAGASGTY
jgi:hypothetical protein